MNKSNYEASKFNFYQQNGMKIVFICPTQQETLHLVDGNSKKHFVKNT